MTTINDEARECLVLNETKAAEDAQFRITPQNTEGYSMKPSAIPSFVHRARWSAEREALRLAQAHPYCEFTVFEAVGTVRIVDGVPKWSDPV
ncbi:MAG: hypothetical protein ACRDAM_15895 [Casimicrobium sp.]